MIRYRSGDLPGLEALSCQSNHVFTDHLHNGHVLWINYRGGERFRVQGNTSVLQPGCLSLIAAGVVHANEPNDPGARDLRSLYLEEPFWVDLAQRLELPGFVPSRLKTREIADRGLWQGMAEWHTAIMAGEDVLSIEQTMLPLFSRLLATAPWDDGQVGRQPRRSQRLFRMLEFMQCCSHERLSLGDLARIGQCSEMHVLRLFKTGVWMTPHAYLVQIRLEQARSRLATGMAVVDAALEAGFADQSHLHRNFVRRYGLTPAQYQNQCR
jgi:AraC-like DNA-binding protein